MELSLAASLGPIEEMAAGVILTLLCGCSFWVRVSKKTYTCRTYSATNIRVEPKTDLHGNVVSLVAPQNIDTDQAGIIVQVLARRKYEEARCFHPSRLPAQLLVPAKQRHKATSL